MDNDGTEDSIEEIGSDRKTVFGNKKKSYHTNLMKGIIINTKNRKKHNFVYVIKKSQNVLISMLEELLSEKDAVEKKRILTDEYGMRMTTELEGRIQIMCNLSENIEERSIRRERLNAIGRMIKANITKEQILSMGYTEAKYLEVENSMCESIGLTEVCP